MTSFPVAPVTDDTLAPPIAATPERSGFGATLAKLSVENQLHGRIERVWDPQGLIVLLVIPLAALNRRSHPR